MSRKKLAVLATGLVILASTVRFYAPNYMVAYVLPLHRADSLMLGILLALVWQWDRGKEFLHKYVSVFRGTCLLLFAVVVYLTYQGVWIGDPWAHLWLALFIVTLLCLRWARGIRSGDSILSTTRFWNGLGTSLQV